MNNNNNNTLYIHWMLYGYWIWNHLDKQFPALNWARWCKSALLMQELWNSTSGIQTDGKSNWEKVREGSEFQTGTWTTVSPRGARRWVRLCVTSRWPRHALSSLSSSQDLEEWKQGFSSTANTPPHNPPTPRSACLSPPDPFSIPSFFIFLIMVRLLTAFDTSDRRSRRETGGR